MPATVQVGKKATPGSVNLALQTADGTTKATASFAVERCVKNAPLGIFSPSNPCYEVIELRADKPINPPVKPVQVPNKSTVAVSVRKRPVDECTLKVTSAPAPAEPNFLATILSIMSPVGVKTSLAIARGASESSIEEGLTKLENLLNLPTQVKNLTECKSADGKEDICQPNVSSDTVLKAFTSAKKDLALKLDSLAGTDLDSTVADIDSKLKRFAEEHPDVHKDWQEGARTRLNTDKLLILDLKKAMNSLLQFRSDLESFKPEVEVPTPFPSNLENVVFTGTVSCTNHFTKQPFGSGTTLTVTFKNALPFSGSAGVAISPLSKRPIGIVENQTTNAKGTTTFSTSVGYTSHSIAQFVPVGFGNLILYGTPKLTFNLSGGVGINPNNGGNQVEYIFGPSLQTHKIYFGVGAHVTRFPQLGNGFYVGEPVTGVTAANLPISYESTIHLGFFISYQPPTPGMHGQRFSDRRFS
jgi:hypothetical protein